MLALATLLIGSPRSGETKPRVAVFSIESPSAWSLLITAWNRTVTDWPGARVPGSVALDPLPKRAVTVLVVAS